jgi:hypothetical protein
MSSKRNPQTAAKRAREQAMREKRERKEAKKLAANLARNAPPEPAVEDLDAEALDPGSLPLASGSEAPPQA